MLPKKYLRKFAAAVVKRSGICQATVEQVLPAIFDEIRYQLCEGQYPCVPIESFGTFAVITKPEREYPYNHKGVKKIVHLPAKKVLKFAPTKNLQREVDAGQYDPSRSAFSHRANSRTLV